ncbi:hypothetical protein EVAR_89820_1 [Eumeta japonica]|uniref:Uncharacterized protein n=1 Tax=Eumeta variegata TaxID=151549 RepID=A0A4C1YGC0_EUMVA|nr:hypothetical protein EVAR_89820_1 [Eumeta japonica]
MINYGRPASRGGRGVAGLFSGRVLFKELAFGEGTLVAVRSRYTGWLDDFKTVSDDDLSSNSNRKRMTCSVCIKPPRKSRSIDWTRHASRVRAGSQRVELRHLALTNCGAWRLHEQSRICSGYT